MDIHLSRAFSRLKFDQDILLLTAILIFLLIFALIPDQDVSVYHCYANVFWHGGQILSDPTQSWCKTFVTHSSPAPLHTLPAEYPILALGIFSLPLLFSFLPYGLSFTFLLCLIIAKLFFHVRFHISKNAGFLFLICVFLSASTIGDRYDLIPSICVLLSLIAAEKKAFSRSYFFLALATLLKIYPFILFLPLFLEEQKQWKKKPLFFWKRYRLLGLTLVSFGASLLVAALLSGGNAFGFAQYMFSRPLQIESVSTSFLWLLSLIHQFSFCVTFAYGSLGISATHAASCVPLSSSVPVIGITILAAITFVVGISIAAVRLHKNRWTIMQTTIALLLLTLCTSKVLSPQYFIWLIPLVVWDRKRKPFWTGLCLLILFLTAIIHPWLYLALPQQHTDPQQTTGELLFFTIVLLRNLTLLTATILWYRMPLIVRAPK